MHELNPFSTAFLTASAGLMALMVPTMHVLAESKVDCGQAPQEIIRSVRVPDPVESLQRAGEALKFCGDTRYLDLIVDRATLEIPPKKARPKQLTGTWVSDMWLHVEKGLTPAIGELLFVEDGEINQGFIRWFDAEKQKDPSYLSAYFPGIGAARLHTGAKGVKVVEFSPSSLKGTHNPYVSISGSDANKHVHRMLMVVPIHLGRITTVRASGDRLLLADSRGIVRTYRRHSMDDILSCHKFFLAAEVNARFWPCVLAVLSRRLADKATQDLTLQMVARSLQVPSLQKAIADTNAGLKQLKPTSVAARRLIKQRNRLVGEMRGIYSKDFESFISQFSNPAQPPTYCRRQGTD